LRKHFYYGWGGFSYNLKKNNCLNVIMNKMNKWIIFGVVIVVVAILAFRPLQLFYKYYLTPCAADGPEKQDDFEMHLEEINLESYYESLEQFDDEFNVQVINEVTYKDKTYPIYQIDSVNESSQNRLLLFAVTHGNEFASALVIPKLLREIGENEVYQSWDVRIVTPVNPVGLDYQSRYNENGCDINRDFKDFQTLGAQIQRDAIQEFNPDIIISLHEGPQKGFFAISTASVSRELESSILSELQKKEVQMASKSFLGLPLTKDGLMHEGFIITTAKKIFGIHTLGSYGELQGVGVITTESSWFDTDAQNRIKPHMIVVETVVNEYGKIAP